MHTEAYTAVMAKVKRGGRERLDGFLPSEFSGISNQERSELVNVFTRENDFLALSAILSKAEFSEFLRNSTEGLDRKSDGYVSALIWAGKVGAIENAPERLVACMPSVSTWAIGEALSYLSSIAIPNDVIKNYIVALVGVLKKKDAAPHVTLKASSELLRLKGIKPKSGEYIELSNRLQAKDRRVKDKALTELLMRA
jgi:hypothetical protein